MSNQRTNATAIAKETPPTPALRYERVMVTPDIAAEFLRSNSTNRPLRRKKVDQYARAMTDGQWQETGQPIIFSKSGRMIDGQHRCAAVMKAGVTVAMTIVRGVADAAFTAIDDSAPRTLADILAIEGWAPWEARSGATAARYALAYQHGSRKLNLSFANAVARDFVFNHPDLMTSVELLAKLPRKPSPTPHSLGAFLHFEMAKLDRDAADRFIRQLWTGENLGPDDIVLQLRNRLLARLLGTKKGAELETIAEAVIRVWNSYRRGKPIKHINNAFRHDSNAVRIE